MEKKTIEKISKLTENSKKDCCSRCSHQIKKSGDIKTKDLSKLNRQIEHTALL